MTREEAIKELQESHDMMRRYNIDESESRLMTALNMAIQALSQEPTEKPMTVDEMEREYEKSKALFHKIVECDDAISRKAVIQTLNKMDRYTATELTLCDTDKKFPANEVFIVDDVYEEIAEQLPSVTPKQRTGHWIEYTRVLIPNPINKWEQAWYCSECGYGNQECEDGSAWLEWNYCPNCGAKMFEPQESEE